MEKHFSIVFLVSGPTVGIQQVFLNKWMREGWVSLEGINMTLETLVIWLPKIWGGRNNLLGETLIIY